MKQGKYFRIPDRPWDLERLWHEAQPLKLDRLPSWVDAEYPNDYRHLGSTSSDHLPDSEQECYKTELEELEAAGLVIDQDPKDSHLNQIYIAAPAQQVWSIGIYSGRSPFDLAPRQSKNPVLTRKSVLDVAAAFVADPFMLHVNHVWYMFFEVMNWRANKGEIGLATSEDG